MMMMMNNRAFIYNFPRTTVAACIQYNTLRVLYCIEALAGHVVCLKRLKIFSFGSFEPLLLLRLNGHVGDISTCRVYQLYDNCIYTSIIGKVRIRMSKFFHYQVGVRIYLLQIVAYNIHHVGYTLPQD